MLPALVALRNGLLTSKNGLQALALPRILPRYHRSPPYTLPRKLYQLLRWQVRRHKHREALSRHVARERKTGLAVLLSRLISSSMRRRILVAVAS